MDPSLLDLPGLPESDLPESLLAALPASTPSPPWHCRVRALVWVQRGQVPLPDDTRFDGRALPLVLGAFVDYLDSPVGPYREVFAGPVVARRGLPAVHVPFIAVDSLPSVHGGRAHWGLPKALATFDGDLGSDGDVAAVGDGWSVRARTGSRGVPVPLAGTFANTQAAGSARVVLRGRGRLVGVDVTGSGPTLSGWLGTGTHVGVVASGRMVVHPARPE